MQCPQCGFENRDDARFCKRCGQSLPGASAVAPPLCPACGAAVKPGARFC
ncbi:MAG: zinc ribbon domain-containing protein, partial [Anaerolineae bacterium]|nr:zinc ribbon domain-containing protein [Anaerolineae bacterium]